MQARLFLCIEHLFFFAFKISPRPPSFYLTTFFLPLFSNFFPAYTPKSNRFLLDRRKTAVESDAEPRISEHKTVAGSWAWKSPKSSASIMRSGSVRRSCNVRYFITKVL